MSDVSGIPNMGFGGGNFFAPQFSYNPQMSAAQASAAYMPAENYNQNVVNNLFSSGGGFGKETNYYSQLGANYAAQGMSPFGVFSDPGLSTPYQSMPDVWTTGASPFQGGGGSSGMGGSIYDSSGFGSLSASPYQTTPNVFDTGSRGFQYPGAGGVDWGGLFGEKQDPFPGMSMPGGLGMPASSPSGAQPFDWSTLWHGGGGAKQDPAPGMAMPGGLNSPMTFPQQPQQQPQQPQTATADPYPGMAMPGGLNSPMTMPKPQSSVFDTGTSPLSGTEFTGPQGGGLGVGGLDWGGLQGATYQPPTEPNRYQTVGPQATTAFDRYFDVTSPNDPERFLSTAEGRPQVTGGSSKATAGGALTPGGGLPAADLAAQAGARLPGAVAELNQPQPTAEQMTAARDRLAQLMGGEKTAETPSPAAPFDQPSLEEFQKGAPFDQPSLAEFQKGGPFDQPSLAQFQEGKADMSMAGRKATLIDTLGKELQAQGLTMTSSYRDPSDPLSIANPNSAHTKGLAFDVRAHTTEQGDAAMGKIRELLNARGLQEGTDYRIIDEVRSPSGWATAAHIHTQFTEGGMQKYQQQAYQDPFPNAPRPPGDIPSTAAPFPARPEGPVEWDPNAPRPPADIPVNDVRSDVVAPPEPAAEPVPLPQARPNAAANLAQAHSVLDSNVGDLVRKNSPANADRVPASIASQTLREALGNAMTGGMIRAGIGPYLPQLGITQADFNKAIAQGQLTQPPRFGSEEASPLQAGAGTRSPDYWDIPKPNTPEWNAGIYEPMVGGGVMQRPENQTIGGASAYNDFTPRDNVDDRRTEFLGRDQLAALKARGVGYAQGPEPAGAATNPLSAALGLGNLPVPTGVGPGGLIRPGGFAGADLTEPNPVTGQQGTSWYDETPYNYGGGLGTNWDPARDQQQQQAQLQTERAPIVAQFENNEGLRNKLFATMVDEMGVGASDQDYAKVAESLFNRAAVQGNSENIDVPSLLGGSTDADKYYQGQQSGKDNVMGSAYLNKLALVQSDPALQARLWNVIQQVGAGGDLSRLSTDNASDKTAQQRLVDPSRSKYGGYGFSDFAPGNPSNPSGEYFFRSDNPFGTAKGGDFIGAGTQRDTREWYKELRPFTSYPPY